MRSRQNTQARNHRRHHTRCSVGCTWSLDTCRTPGQPHKTRLQIVKRAMQVMMVTVMVRGDDSDKEEKSGGDGDDDERL